MEAVMRTDEHHVEKHGRILRMRDEQDIQTVFLGDSLTRRWEDNESLWEQYFSRFSPANFGVGADCLENIKWRIQNGELERIAPERLVLLAGTNNLPIQEADTVSAGIIELIQIIRDKLPQTRLLVLALFPRSPDENGMVFDDKIKAVNQTLANYCAENKLHYADYGQLFLSKDGSINRNLLEDGLHLNAEGYKLLGPKLVDRLKAL